MADLNSKEGDSRIIEANTESSTFRWNLFAFLLGPGTKQERPAPVQSGKERPICDPHSLRVPAPCKQQRKNVARPAKNHMQKRSVLRPKPIRKPRTPASKHIPPLTPSSAFDSKQEQMSPLGQQLQNEARRSIFRQLEMNLDFQSLRILEDATIAKAEKDFARARARDRASLRRLEEAASRLPKFTHCTPPFEPTLWHARTKDTASSVTDEQEYESVPSQTPAKFAQGVISSGGLFSPQSIADVVRHSPQPSDSRLDSSYYQITLPELRGELIGPPIQSDNDLPGTPPRREQENEQHLPATYIDSLPEPNISNPPSSPSSPSPTYTLSPRRDPITGALHLSQQGSLIPRMANAKVLDPQAWEAQQWLEDAISEAIATSNAKEDGDFEVVQTPSSEASKVDGQTQSRGEEASRHSDIDPKAEA